MRLRSEGVVTLPGLRGVASLDQAQAAQLRAQDSGASAMRL